MINFQNEYEKFIKDEGVGSNDVVADSCKSYLSYLNSVSKHLEIVISPKTLSHKNDIYHISESLTKLGTLSPKTIKNYGSAMKQYVNMVSFLGLKNS